ncbi:hypothetical protein HY386_00420 [Candidatus Daviesbacteria bacterium]|nr:hypothetical protein [Candidatus Daviesbacteria bacterium]
MNDILMQTSLIAAYVAGMVALFAPCCVTFLLPAYLGSVFKEKEKVLFMTFIFGLGIFVVLLPAVLGVAFVSKFLFRYHDWIYIFGGLVMLLVAAATFFNIKMPMPNLPGLQVGKRTDVVSIFILGIFSGITSACCAPVLVGILTLTFLSPSFWGALLIGAMYVLGMVTPLLLMSIFLENKVAKLSLLRRPVFEGIILSNLIASLVFFLTGLVILYLSFTGRLSSSGMDQFTKLIQNAGGYVNEMIGSNLAVNILFLILVGYFIYWIIKRR